MEESSTLRAIFIAVGVFAAIATITAVILYYNAAKDMVKATGGGVDFDAMYNDYIEELLLKSGSNASINGTDLKNLLNYFYNNEQIRVNVEGIISLNDVTAREININNLNNNKFEYNKIFPNIVPTQEFSLNKKEERGIININLRSK